DKVPESVRAGCHGRMFEDTDNLALAVIPPPSTSPTTIPVAGPIVLSKWRELLEVLGEASWSIKTRTAALLCWSLLPTGQLFSCSFAVMPIVKEEKLNKNPESFDAVKKEVEASKYADWKHATVDAAKKRAIYSSGSYKEFQDIVATCELNPIARNEFSRPARQQTHNRALNGKENRRGKAASPLVDANGPRIRARDFERNLRRARTDAERMELLCDLGPARVVEALKGSDKAEYVDAEVLLYILEALRSAVEAGHAGDEGVTRGILEALLRDPPVARTISRFLTPEERGRIRETGVLAGVDFATLQLISK
ncbi:hypothetical protein FOZ62_022782, partial [Perkinsus olseni]